MGEGVIGGLRGQRRRGGGKARPGGGGGRERWGGVRGMPIRSKRRLPATAGMHSREQALAAVQA